jgi:hypothetical protein
MKEQELIASITTIINDINETIIANFMAKTSESSDLSWCPLLELRVSTYYIYVSIFDRVLWDSDNYEWPGQEEFKQLLQANVRSMSDTIVASLEPIVIGFFSDSHRLYPVYSDRTSTYDLPINVNTIQHTVEIIHENDKIEVLELLKPSKELHAIAKAQALLDTYFNISDLELTTDQLYIKGFIVPND